MTVLIVRIVVCLSAQMTVVLEVDILWISMPNASIKKSWICSGNKELCWKLNFKFGLLNFSFENVYSLLFRTELGMY